MAKRIVITVLDDEDLVEIVLSLFFSSSLDFKGLIRPILDRSLSRRRSRCLRGLRKWLWCSYCFESIVRLGAIALHTPKREPLFILLSFKNE
jgi:hypothetical protein